MIEMWDELFAQLNPDISEFLKNGDYSNAFESMHKILDEVWHELFRVMKSGAFACINIGDATRTVKKRFQLFANHSRIQQKCFDIGFDVLPVILWRKQTNAPNKFMGSGMLPAGAYVTLEHEYILIFRKGNKRVFVSAEEKHNRMQSSYFWEERNTWFSDLWDFKGTRQDINDQELRNRSAAYPFLLPFRLINMYSVFGDTVLDPFF
jgi:DNA modification methylase